MLMFPLRLTCLNPIILTYIHVRNRGYIVVYFQVQVCSQFWAHNQYMGHGFNTHLAFGVMIYSTHVCWVTLSVQCLVLSVVIKASVSILKPHSFSQLKPSHWSWSALFSAWYCPCNFLFWHAWIQLPCYFFFSWFVIQFWHIPRVTLPYSIY